MATIGTIFFLLLFLNSEKALAVDLSCSEAKELYDSDLMSKDAYNRLVDQGACVKTPPVNAASATEKAAQPDQTKEDLLAEQGKILNAGGEDKAAEAARKASAAEAAQRIAEEENRKAKERLDRLASQGIPENSADIEHDLFLRDKANRDLIEKRIFSEREAKSAKDREVRNSLLLVSAATQVARGLEVKRTQILLDIAALAKIASTNLRRKDEMNSLNQNSPLLPGQTQSEQTATSSLSAASKREAETAAEDQASTDGADKKDDSSLAKSKEIAKLKAALADVAKRKKAAIARYRKSQAGKKSEAEINAEVDKLFAGELRDEAAGGRGLASVDESQSEKSKNPVLAALREQFTMDGVNTDAQIRRMVSEVQDLQSGEPMQGVMGVDTLSLFIRVKNAHDQCLRKHCVGELSKK